MSISLTDIVIFHSQFRGVYFSLSVEQVLFWGIALIIGILARRVVGRRLPFGYIGTIIMALLGIWLATDVILIDIPLDILFYNVPLLKSTLGAIVFEILWYVIAYRSYRVWSRRRTYKTLPPALDR
ncbi:hypothetical protein [Dictyobacter arantiisoli]|uniref:Uncharacterized protein n=1 Tax=Dictyobacter arantiisoli TaxID=2014874 RepID=A0A5A5TIV0_9CHLR|nr:hypothetical protein [Dictyobacter arantiisoli]GCF11155.1 hypothetical protein KDI_47190 [Dictyobacter arantiisoli]